MGGETGCRLLRSIEDFDLCFSALLAVEFEWRSADTGLAGEVPYVLLLSPAELIISLVMFFKLLVLTVLAGCLGLVLVFPDTVE